MENNEVGEKLSPGQEEHEEVGPARGGGAGARAMIELVWRWEKQ